MTFEELLDEALGMIQRRGRVTYRALQLQFELDDDRLDALKDELLFAHCELTEEEGRGLTWTGEAPAPTSNLQPETDSESRFHALLPEVMVRLQRDKRVTYRTLKYLFGLDDAFLEGLRKELSLRHLAVDEEGEVLVWTGEAPSRMPPGEIVSSQPNTDTTAATISPASLAHQSHVTATDTTTNELPSSPEDSAVEPPPAEQLAAPQSVRSTPEAELRQLTVMFCDLVGSTDLSGKLDPEELREVVQAYQKTTAEVVERYEGYIAQYLGDGLLIYFGYPVAHEDAPQRAVYTGLGIPEAMATLNRCLKADYGVQLAVRIGIHTGPVVVGEMGGGGRHEHLALGETPNIAARLEGLAHPNTVVISPTTARLVEGGFALADLETHVLKGVTEPTQVWRVLGPAEVHPDEDDSMPDGSAFLVGREEEIGLLLRRWEQSKEGLGQVVLVSGEAGIGKSSLIATARTHVMEEDGTQLTFRCSPYHTNSALYPVLAHLEKVLGFEREDNSGTKLDKLEQVLRTTSLPLAESVPLLAVLLSVPLGDRYPAPSQSPQQQRQQTLDALMAWLIEASETQPVLAVWEDLHWADPSTLELLGLFVDQAPTASMLHLMTFRPEFEPPWPTRSHITPITLNRLERSQVKALITCMSDGKTLPVEVVEHIVAKTDGVPLYVEELTKMLLESDLLQEEGDRYTLTGPLVTVAIPATLQDSLMARLDQLNMAKEIAQLGAVLGREFTYELIAGIASHDDETLRDGLRQLVQAELLYQRGRPPRAKYIFKHALIQDAAYASLLRGTRQQIHQHIAHLLVERFPETMTTQPELVAHHYTEAGQHEQAVACWQQAAQRAVERSAHPEAIAHLTAGIEGLKTLPDTPARAQRELTLQRSLGVSLLATKGYSASEVAATYIRARDLCQEIGETSQLYPVLWGLYLWHIMQAEFHTAQELAEQYAALLQGQHDPERSLWSHVMLGCVAFYRAQFGVARQHLEQGLALDGPQQPRSQHALYGQDPGVMCRIYAAHSLHYLGYPDQALAAMQEAIKRACTPFDLGRTFPWSTLLHQLRGEMHAAQTQAETAIDLCQKHRFDLYLEGARAAAGWNQVVRGQSAQGLAEMQQAIEWYKNAGAKLFRVCILAHLADAYGMMAQHDRGLAILTETLTTINQTGERWWEAELHRLKGKLLCAQSVDKQDEAETCFHQALETARRQEAKSWELRTATSLARLWQSQGKRQAAYELLAPVYEWFTEGFDTTDLKDAKVLLDELEG